jgi:hypothetical protein
MVVRAELPYSE